MTISMIGIDHDRAPVDIRALFAFTKKNAGEAMEKLKETAGIHGCIILSTCNRLEIWASHEDDQELSLYQCLCQLKNIQDDSYESYFVSRTDREAVEHLFYLAGGLKSQILGEDQILTQIKDALNLAREHFTTDSTLEVLFRMAVTAGKKIKTEAPLAHGNPSVIHQAVSHLKEQGYDMHGKICMVIGNGEMGKVTALALKEAGAKRAVLLNVSGPFHSSLLTGAGEKLEAVLKELTIEKPQIPYVANVDASYITEQADIMPRLVSQVSHSVRWQQSVEKMVENGVDTFIEIGPGRTLAGFNKKIAKAIGKELTTYNVATMEDIDKVVEALK